MCFFIAYREFPETVEPRMTNFHNPSPRFEIRMTYLFTDLLTARADVRNIAIADYSFARWFSGISGISTKIFLFRTIFRWKVDPVFQYGINLRNVVPIRTCDDDRQRDATLVYQQMTFGTIFFPCPSDSGRRFPWPRGLSSWSRQCFATPRPSPPSHRIQQALAATGQGKSLPAPTCENRHAPNWNSQTVLLARLSIGFQYEAHKQSPRTPYAGSMASGLRLIYDDISCSDLFEVLGSGVQLSSRTHRTLPKTGSFSFALSTSSAFWFLTSRNITRKRKMSSCLFTDKL